VQAARIHSRYTRWVADLPCAGRQVTLLLTVRKFFCPNPACPRSIFAEQFPELAPSYARLTTRLREALLALGLATSGEVTSRLAPRLGMQVAPTTLLRRVRAVPVSQAGQVRVLGVDDFAWKKGQTYGTILVDLALHRPVDLLPDRAEATLEAWLRGHPEIQVISRDRGGEYIADQARGGLSAPAPSSASAALERSKFFRHRSPQLRVVSADSAPTSPEEMPAQVSRSNRYACYEVVQTLHQQALSQREIARRLKMSRRTVHRLLKAATFPERSRASYRGSILDADKPSLLDRWKAGCWNGAPLYSEVKQQARRADSNFPPTGPRAMACQLETSALSQRPHVAGQSLLVVRLSAGQARRNAAARPSPDLI
jgi:transposase